METAYLETPIGILELKAFEKGLSSAIFIEQMPENKANPTAAVLKAAVQQLSEYFSGNRIEFDLPLDLHGTDFQQRVWQQLQTIPFSKTNTYQQMANALGDPKVIRAAASANGKNPISIIVPCHRVIGSDGSLTGYAGGLHRKKWLLEHENPVKQQSLF